MRILLFLAFLISYGIVSSQTITINYCDSSYMDSSISAEGADYSHLVSKISERFDMKKADTVARIDMSIPIVGEENRWSMEISYGGLCHLMNQLGSNSYKIEDMDTVESSQLDLKIVLYRISEDDRTQNDYYFHRDSMVYILGPPTKYGVRSGVKVGGRIYRPTSMKYYKIKRKKPYRLVYNGRNASVLDVTNNKYILTEGMGISSVFYESHPRGLGYEKRVHKGIPINKDKRLKHSKNFNYCQFLLAFMRPMP